jgi:hypothetical protein
MLTLYMPYIWTLILNCWYFCKNTWQVFWFKRWLGNVEPNDLSAWIAGKLTAPSDPHFSALHPLRCPLALFFRETTGREVWVSCISVTVHGRVVTLPLWMGMFAAKVDHYRRGLDPGISPSSALSLLREVRQEMKSYTYATSD